MLEVAARTSMERAVEAITNARIAKAVAAFSEDLAAWNATLSVSVGLNASNVEVVEISVLPSSESHESLDRRIIVALCETARKCDVEMLAANWLFGTPGHLEMQLCDKAAVHGALACGRAKGSTRMVESPTLMSDIEMYGSNKLADVAFVSSKLSLECAKSVRLAVGMWYQRDLWMRALPLNHKDCICGDANVDETVHLNIHTTEAQRAAVESHMTGSDVAVRQFTVAFGNCQDVVPIRFLVDLVTACGAEDVRVSVQECEVGLIFDQVATSVAATQNREENSVGSDEKRRVGRTSEHEIKRGIASKVLHFARSSSSKIAKTARQKWMNYNAAVARQRVRDLR